MGMVMGGLVGVIMGDARIKRNVGVLLGEVALGRRVDRELILTVGFLFFYYPL
jgi:hypothetical protein